MNTVGMAQLWQRGQEKAWEVYADRVIPDYIDNQFKTIWMINLRKAR